MIDLKPEEPIPCHHLTGYWIHRGVSFRCYECGCQFHIADISVGGARKIEKWTHYGRKDCEIPQL